MKCSNCGAENADGKRYCCDCGSPFKTGEALHVKAQKRVGKQIAALIVMLSALLIIIGFGIVRASNELDQYGGDSELVAHSLLDLAWLFGLLGFAGFFIAGLALLLSYPTPKMEKKASLTSEKTTSETQ